MLKASSSIEIHLKFIIVQSDAVFYIIQKFLYSLLIIHIVLRVNVYSPGGGFVRTPRPVNTTGRRSSTLFSKLERTTSLKRQQLLPTVHSPRLAGASEFS